MVVLSTSGDAAIRCVEEKEQRDSEERARRRKIIEVGLGQESTINKRYIRHCIL